MKRNIRIIALLLIFACVLTTLVACGGESTIKKGFTSIVKYIENSTDYKTIVALESYGYEAEINVDGIYRDGDDCVYYDVWLHSRNAYGKIVGSNHYYLVYNINNKEVSEKSDAQSIYLKYWEQYRWQEQGKRTDDGKKYYYVENMETSSRK